MQKDISFAIANDFEDLYINPPPKLDKKKKIAELENYEMLEDS